MGRTGTAIGLFLPVVLLVVNAGLGYGGILVTIVLLDRAGDGDPVGAPAHVPAAEPHPPTRPFAEHEDVRLLARDVADLDAFRVDDRHADERMTPPRPRQLRYTRGPR